MKTKKISLSTSFHKNLNQNQYNENQKNPYCC